MNIYVGNLSKNTNDSDLIEIFSEYGTVSSAKVIKDMYSGESKGFGFVEMPSKTEGEKAVTELNSCEFDGKVLVINEARPKKENSFGSGFRGNSGRDNRPGNNNFKGKKTFRK